VLESFGVFTESREKRDAGRAIKTTPRRENIDAKNSVLVNDSFREGISEQANEAMMGAKKVITVASESSRYASESAVFHSHQHRTSNE